MTSTGESLAAALEREHRQIDEGLELFQADSPSGSDALAAAIVALRRHIYLEEEFVFPVLAGGALVAPVMVMLREHAQIWRTLESLERDMADGVSSDARQTCHQLLVQLQHHNMKEERILYPEADKALATEATARLTAFLDSGSLPDGWVCIKARS